MLALIGVATVPVYMIIAALAGPMRRQTLNGKFDRGAESQQFLAEPIVGLQAVKASAVERITGAQGEERHASYVHSAFKRRGAGWFGEKRLHPLERGPKTRGVGLVERVADEIVGPSPARAER